jgi:hypothetical protein
MYQELIKTYEQVDIGNEWGFYTDIENYKYNINHYSSNKIIKRNKIQDNDNGNKFDFDFDFEKKIYEKKVSNVFIKISSATIISAAVSYLIFYMS